MINDLKLQNKMWKFVDDTTVYVTFNEIKTLVLQAYFQSKISLIKYIVFIARNKCVRNINILMVALSGNSHA